jgi:hypothetical protein
MRKLTISRSINLNGCKEFNHLRISNIEHFLSDYGNNLDYYSSPFKIIYDLEKTILFENEPKECILIPYKPDGDIIFRIKEIKEENNLRIVIYEYEGSVS